MDPLGSPPPTIYRRPKNRRSGLKWAVGVALVLVLASAGILADQLVKASPPDTTADANTTTTTAALPTTTTTGSPGPDPQLVEDAHIVSTDMSRLMTDQGTLEQLAQTVSSESQTLEQYCSAPLVSQLSSNAVALDGAAQTVTNDSNQLNSDWMAYHTLELTEPTKAPADAAAFFSVLNAVTSASGDLTEAGLDRGMATQAMSEASC